MKQLANAVANVKSISVTSASSNAVENVLSRRENGLEARPVEFDIHGELSRSELAAVVGTWIA